MQYLEYRLSDLKKIWHVATMGFYVFSSGVLTSWPHPRWRRSRHLAFSITCIILNTAWGIWTKFAPCHKGSLPMFWLSFDLLTKSKMAAQPPSWNWHYMQYLEYRLSDLNQIWQDVTKGLYLCSSWVLTSWLHPRWRRSRHLGFSISCNISNIA